MGDLSESFNPADIATASDAASDAISKVATVSDAASDALSKAYSRCATISDALSKAISDALSKAYSRAQTVSDAASKATSDARSDATSKFAVVSDAASDAKSDATSKLAAKATTSDVTSKFGVLSDAASKALSRANTASDAASKAKAQSSDVASKVTTRSATWDTKTLILKVYNEASAIAAGDGAMYFAVPAALTGMNLTSVESHLYTAATSGVVAVQIANVTSGVDMLSSARILEWDVTEKDTADAAASSVAVISTGADGVVTGEEIRIDIDDAASGAKGLEVRLQFRTP